MRDFVPLTILSGAIMAKFINPFTDVGFKIIFGQEMTKGLLIDFLNDLLVDERHIQDILFWTKNCKRSSRVTAA
jgi:hypothetical protein